MTGITPSERYLTKLCRRSFLRLWSWPNVYRDQKSGRSVIGKEVCDLLVVFDNHVFIFSDKYCEFPNTGDVRQDWARWFKKAILKSAIQVCGAERWLRKYPGRLFLDKTCKHPFPVSLPPIEQAVFHRMVVAHGSAQRCRDYFGSGSGSLIINPSLAGRDHYDFSTPLFSPFNIGRVTEAKSFIHVIDDFSLDVLLGTLDTAPDLARYLDLRGHFIESRKLQFATGEEDLLAYYLRHVDNAGCHHFYLPNDATTIAVGEGSWRSFSNHPQYKAKLEADGISYAWDKIIDKFTEHLLEGTQYQIPEYRLLDSSVKVQERGLRILAKEGRVRRRMIAKAILGVIRNGNENPRAVRVVPGDPYYIFLSLQAPSSRTYEEYRKGRARLLEAYCLCTRLEFPNARLVVGIATEPENSASGRSEDMCVLDGGMWNEELAKEAARVKSEYEIFTSLRKSHYHESEYPLTRPQLSGKGRDRNKLCPCGSGRKYKKCHGSQSS